MELLDLLNGLATDIAELQQVQNTFNNEKITNGILQFTRKEIANMPKCFARALKKQNCVVLYRKCVDEKNDISYEIRYHKNGYNISVSAPTLATAKQRFTEKIKKFEGVI